MKQLKIIIKYYRSILLLTLFLGNVACVDSLNDPYANIVFDNDTTTDRIDAPSELNISEFISSKIFGLWWKDNSDNEDGFEVWRKDELTGEYLKIATLEKNSTAYNDTINDGTLEYFYKIRAYKNTSYSNFSNEVSTNQNLVLANPSDLNGYIIKNTNIIQLDWKDNSENELGFIIERKLLPEIDFTEKARVGSDDISWTDKSAEHLTNHTILYRVLAYSESEQSNYSNIFTIRL